MKHHSNAAFTITMTGERQLEDFSRPNDDDLCRIQPMLIMGSRNFYWWELRTVREIIRIEAIRAADAEADEDYHWPSPRRFRIVSITGDERAEREVASSALFDQSQGGINPTAEPVLQRLAQADFISLSYAVGRRTVTIVPQKPADPTESSQEATKRQESG